MKDVDELLRQKELEVARLQKEVEALHVVAPLLTEAEAEAESEDYKQGTRASSAAQQLIDDLRAKETPQQTTVPLGGTEPRTG